MEKLADCPDVVVWAELFFVTVIVTREPPIMTRSLPEKVSKEARFQNTVAHTAV